MYRRVGAQRSFLKSDSPAGKNAKAYPVNRWPFEAASGARAQRLSVLSPGERWGGLCELMSIDPGADDCTFWFYQSLANPVTLRAHYRIVPVKFFFFFSKLFH